MGRRLASQQVPVLRGAIGHVGAGQPTGGRPENIQLLQVPRFVKQLVVIEGVHPRRNSGTVRAKVSRVRVSVGFKRRSVLLCLASRPGCLRVWLVLGSKLVRRIG